MYGTVLYPLYPNIKKTHKRISAAYAFVPKRHKSGSIGNGCHDNGKTYKLGITDKRKAT